VSERDNQAGDTPRVHLAICEAIVGVMAIVGTVASVYAFIAAPRVQDIPVYVDRTLSLFIGPVIQVLLFLAMILLLVRWKEYVRKYRYFPTPHDTFGATSRVDIVQIMKFMAVGACVIGAVGLWVTLSRAAMVLGAQ
jgi:hypothetical protein